MKKDQQEKMTEYFRLRDASQLLRIVVLSTIRDILLAFLTNNLLVLNRSSIGLL